MNILMQLNKGDVFSFPTILKKIKFLGTVIWSLLFVSFVSCTNDSPLKILENESILHYVLDPSEGNLKMYWKDDENQIIGSLNQLNTFLNTKGETLIFATNGGMYTKEQNPQGLFIENGSLIQGMDTDTAGYGNFYLCPNGALLLNDDNTATIKETQDIKSFKNVVYATQSGPMLLHNGKYNNHLTEGSKNVHIRSGVGVMPDGKLLFAMSKKKMNFYDFASFFKVNQCANALYLDGFVSRMYLPEKDWIQLDGNFGVLIGVSKSN
ncbi:MAG: phosphodiester glycosidase family protein [Saprospiraceae bacterium]|nr:phosphodiester glycosidase family protein [Saprospiraceae bacterium]